MFVESQSNLKTGPGCLFPQVALARRLRRHAMTITFFETKLSSVTARHAGNKAVL